MFRVSDFLKISLLALFINMAPPVLCFMCEQAHGQLTPQVPQPANTPLGSMKTWNGISGILAVEYGDPGDDGFSSKTWLIVPRPAGQTVSGSLWAYLVGIDNSLVASGPHNVGSGAQLSLGTYNAKLNDTSLGNIGGTPFARWLLANGELWDADGDGDEDMTDVNQIMTDMDGDGEPNATDTDTDGDGELDVVEARMEAATGIPHKYNVNSFPDRDGDGLPDMNDNDGDGWPNWLESWPKANGMGTVSDPNDAESHPAGSSSDIESWYPILVSKNPDYPGTAFQGPNPFGDDDNDGAFNWLELIAPTPSNDPTWFPDGNGDGIWDWFVEPGGGGGGIIIGEPEDEPEPPDPPDPPGPPPPFVPPPAPPTVFTPGAQTGGTITAPSPTNNPNQMYVDNSNSSQSSNIGAGSGTYVDGNGNPINVYLPPGTGSSGTTQGEGDYVVIDVPKGVSTNYQGAGGGTWKQRASPDRGEQLEDAADGISEGLEGMRPAFGGSTNGAYGAATDHVMTFTLTLPGLGERTFHIPTLPDTSTWYGTTLETIRNLIILVAKVVSSWVCFTKIWQALRQSF